MTWKLWPSRKKTTIFKIRLVYKSGYTHDFECLDFQLKGGSAEWVNYKDKNKPLVLGMDELAAVWQVGHRKAYV